MFSFIYIILQIELMQMLISWSFKENTGDLKCSMPPWLLVHVVIHIVSEHCIYINSLITGLRDNLKPMITKTGLSYVDHLTSTNK